jgi:hypothetical protein
MTTAIHTSIASIPCDGTDPPPCATSPSLTPPQVLDVLGVETTPPVAAAALVGFLLVFRAAGYAALRWLNRPPKPKVVLVGGGGVRREAREDVAQA